MANDIRMQDPRLRDPINNISDGLKDPTLDSTPGFFQSLRNPFDLMLEESLPASLYQWITGNTKKKQAQEALAYIQNNPHLAGTKIYKEAERKLQRFGYLLDEGPMSIDMKEVGNFNIRVNAVAPGLTKTSMMEKDISKKIIDETINKVPLKRPADPDEISNVILFLASDLSSYISGEVVFVTGGY